MRQRLASLLLGAIIVLSGCESDRDRLMHEKYPTYPNEIKRAIDRGYAIMGMDHDQVYLAFGEPMCKKIIQHQEKPVEVWLYPPGGRDPCMTAVFRVYFEDGKVTGWNNFTGATRFTNPPGGVP
jgi:outer membrane protein assembly factor BamE